MIDENNTYNKVYTVSEIQKILCISKNTAYKLVKNDPPFKVIKFGESYRVLKTSFDEWLNK